LAQLLVKQCGARSPFYKPALTLEKVMDWIDAHRERTGRWPTMKSGPIDGTDGEKWANIDAALKTGGRGLEGGSSLARLLSQKRGVRNPQDLPDLTAPTILAWADAHYERRGEWPKSDSGPIDGDPGATWKGVDVALIQGLRGLPGGS